MQKIQFDYFTGMEAEQYSFYRVPKVLFTEPCFKALSCEAKVLYGLMLDRMSLSIKNRWLDSEDRVYIIFTVEEIAELKVPLTEVQENLKKLRDIRYWVRKATPGTEESKEPPKKQPIKEVLQDKADEKKAQRTAPVQTKHKQQDMEL